MKMLTKTHTQLVSKEVLVPVMKLKVTMKKRKKKNSGSELVKSQKCFSEESKVKMILLLWMLLELKNNQNLVNTQKMMVLMKMKNLKVMKVKVKKKVTKKKLKKKRKKKRKKKKKEDSGLRVEDVIKVVQKEEITLLKKNKMNNYTDSFQKLKETGLTICLKMKNKMMVYSIVTLSNHSNTVVRLMKEPKLEMK